MWAALLAAACPCAPARAAGGYADTVLAGAPAAYWRLGETSGAVAADRTGHAAAAYLGGVELGARGALSGDPDTAARFDGADDEVRGSVALAGSGTLEGWFFWEAGVALLRDDTGSAGWILAYDSGGRIAYRAGGATFTTDVPTAQLRDGWHHLALTFSPTATALYVDGALAHADGAPGPAAADMPWHVMRNGATGQYARGRADEVAVYGQALEATAVRAHFEAGRDLTDTTPPGAPVGLTASGRLGKVVLDWADSAEPDLDGYDVFRATAPAGPFARVNASRLSASAFTDTSVSGGTAYVYVVTASDTANHRSADSAPASATPPAAEDLLRRYSPELRYESQESYFADSAAEMTDNFVAGSRTNYLVDGTGTRLAAADPADPLADLSLSYLGDPAYADGRSASPSDHLDAANGSYQQDAQRMRAAGYGDRIYGRTITSGGRLWLQYWLFYYYNPQNLLGFGVHEGDWEFAQLGLDADGVPEVAAYAQHDGAERCAWSQVTKRAGAPVVYVALASHASYFAPGVAGRGIYPDDYHRGGGYRVRPALDVVSTATPLMAWRGKWGASGGSPVAPRRHSGWGDPAGFSSAADACTVGATASRSGEPPSAVPAPRVAARTAGGHVLVRYRFDARRRPPSTLLVGLARTDAPDLTVARRVRIRARAGAVRLATPRGSGRLELSASAFGRRGTRSRIVSLPLAG